MSMRNCPKHGPYVADDSTDFGETRCPQCIVRRPVLCPACGHPVYRHAGLEKCYPRALAAKQLEAIQ